MRFTNVNVLLLLLLPFLRLYSQSFSVINPSKEYYFETDFVDMADAFSNYNSCETGECILGIRVDSIAIAGGDKHYFFPQLLRGGTWSQLCLNSSWMGLEAIEDSSGNFIFFNSRNDSILFKPHSHLNESWKMVNLSNGASLFATVTAETIDSIFNTIDSIKVFTLQAKDSLGNNISHVFNGLQFVITKNYGFYKTFDLFHFPSDTSAKILIGETNPDIGTINLTDFASHDAGDEFHYSGSYHNNWDFSFKYYYTRLIYLSKSFSVDSITYRVDKTYYERSGKPMQGIADTIYYRDTLEFSVDTVNDGDPFKTLSFEQLYNTGIWPNGYQLFYKQNDMLFKHFIDFFLPGDSSSCMQAPIGSGVFETRTYALGLGFYSLVNADGNNDTYENLVYYKKGSVEWGIPLNFDSITSVIPLPDIEHYFWINPNPASDFITISSDLVFNGTIEITITNLVGQRLLFVQKAFEKKMEIDIPVSITGVNVLALTLPKVGTLRKKLVIF